MTKNISVLLAINMHDLVTIDSTILSAARDRRTINCPKRLEALDYPAQPYPRRDVRCLSRLADLSREEFYSSSIGPKQGSRDPICALYEPRQVYIERSFVSPRYRHLCRILRREAGRHPDMVSSHWRMGWLLVEHSRGVQEVCIYTLTYVCVCSLVVYSMSEPTSAATQFQFSPNAPRENLIN